MAVGRRLADFRLGRHSLAERRVVENRRKFDDRPTGCRVQCTAVPSSPRGCPFLKAREFSWSSTTSAFESDWAWALYLELALHLEKGAAGVGGKGGGAFSFGRLQRGGARDVALKTCSTAPDDAKIFLLLECLG